jgi:hypothetical protein
MKQKRYWLIGGITFVIMASLINILLSFSYGMNSVVINAIRLFNLHVLSTIPIYIDYFSLSLTLRFNYSFWLIAVIYWFVLGSILGATYSAIIGIKNNSIN